MVYGRGSSRIDGGFLVDAGVWAEGSQAYLWPSDTCRWCVCDKMIDWVTPTCGGAAAQSHRAVRGAGDLAETWSDSGLAGAGGHPQATAAEGCEDRDRGPRGVVRDGRRAGVTGRLSDEGSGMDLALPTPTRTVLVAVTEDRAHHEHNEGEHQDNYRGAYHHGATVVDRASGRRPGR